MAVTRIHHLLVETHNWGKSAKFWQELGWTLAEGHETSGKLVAPGGGPYIWLSEVPQSKTPVFDVYFELEADGFAPRSPVQVIDALAATHWGTRLMTVRDPDGRVVRLQAT
jgi:hypothetical protein